MAAAKVGGINANNNFGADFIFDNTQIQNNVIHAAHIADINNLLFLGSSCVYPKNSRQPIKEKYLLSGELEKTGIPAIPSIKYKPTVAIAILYPKLIPKNLSLIHI